MTDPNAHPDLPSESSQKTRQWQPGEPESRQTGDFTIAKQAELGPEAIAGHLGRIGRYRIERVLGQGGFGVVYLAHDDQLQRLVAIKVPHRHRVSTIEDAEAYLTEARTVANLDHPNIVPVHDVGSTDQFPCYVVSKYIDGTDLAKRLKQSRLSLHEAVELLATVAEALHHAHKQGIVHRDIKPGNILLDKSGKPFVADFGLALREQEVGTGTSYAGTPAYMSPEQARGEGHRVDGRSDIFGLGVVFYELLVGRRPFRAESQAELMEQVTSHEPRPPRQYDDQIPKELDRICLKALSKRASERYSAARDMADDLRHFLAEHNVNRQSGHDGRDTGSPAVMLVMQPPLTPIASSPSGATPDTPNTPTSDRQPIKIVPKGLRCFDAHDADFFLELLPGPRDRDGLPDSIRFWKTRIEEADAEKTFSVGLICGPSGCGKSSLVQAGLLPHLSDDVIAVYVEATAKETETRLLNGLRKRCPALSDSLSLKETLAALRRGQGIPVGKKVLIVLDQFEQWLHAKKEEQNTELVQSLRQCDGGRVQCIVMVRDDFWMAVTRFLSEMEVELLQGKNFAAADLFDLRHARKVLSAFGQAFGTLPEIPKEMTPDQQEFLKQAMSGLAQEGKVICVRLALFAEMMKGKAWTPASLKQVGGTEGVGVTFLEETFSSSTANPKHRYHQKAARAVLKALLPDSGTDIKGHMRLYADLLEASGYGSRSKDFDDVIRILDNEIRLITPTDPEGKEGADDSTSQAQPGQKYYQLTHDYLVHSIREWLTRKQKETRRGRAELLLADRASVWNARPENRQLPSLLQWFQIKWLTQKNNWTPPQQKMMREAGRYYVVRGSVMAVLLALIGWGGYEGYGRLRAAALVQTLLTAETADVREITRQLSGFHRWAAPTLRNTVESSDDRKAQLHASLALLQSDPSQVDYLSKRLLTATPDQVAVIVAGLADRKGEVIDRFWSVLNDANGDADGRLRAACALAAYTPDDARWKKVGGDLVAKLITENPVLLGKWTDALRPVSGFLAALLADMIQDERINESRKIAACDVVAAFAADDPTQFQELEKRLAMPIPATASDEQKISLAKQKANVAAALLRINQYDKMREVLKNSPDPTARSYLIHRFSPLAIDPKVIWKELQSEKEVSVRRALVLGLGEFDPGQLLPAEREAMISQVAQWYRDDPDPGVHGATEWLLRHWKQDQWLKQIEQEWTKDKKQRELRLQHVGQELATGKAKPQWYVTSQGQTMVVIPGPVEFLGREPLSKIRIDQTFAIAEKDVTVEQYRRFRKDHKGSDKDPDCPVEFVSWYDAAAYCNWLSEQEEIPENQWCYEPNSTKTFAAGMKIRVDRRGYRLPSEWEWECACRAGSVTNYCFGQADELLGRYGWDEENRNSPTRPVGTLKPNDLGLFDMHGSVWQWCQDAYDGGGSAMDAETVQDKTYRSLRGGGFWRQPGKLRSAIRSHTLPTLGFSKDGFRPARTLPSIIPLPRSAEGESDLNALKIKSPLDEAIAIYRQTIRRNPNDTTAYIRLATAYQAAGRTRESVPILAKASANPYDTYLSMKVAALQAWFGQEQEYGETCKRALDFAKGKSDPMTTDRMSKICCLRPTEDKTRLQSALALARKAVELGKNNVYLPWFQMSLGMAEYRNGNYAAANQALLTAAKSGNSNRYVTVTSAFYRAMSLFRQGKPDEARKLATEAAVQMNPPPKDESNPLAGNDAGHDNLILWLAYKEAKALINFDAAPAARVQLDGK